MNFILAGGGMKVSYQIGQVAALVNTFGPPKSIYSVSSGLITASMVAAYGGSGDVIRSKYEEHLRSLASKGILPSLKVNRTIASSVCCDLLKNASERHVGRVLAFGASRSDSAPLSVDLWSNADPLVLEALMSIPTVLDSRFSRKVGIIDGGYVQNVPWNFAPHEPAYVLSYVAPSDKNPRSLESFSPQWQERLPRLRGAYRHAWAYVNSTFPHRPADRTQLVWCFPASRLCLNFFSRNFSAHMNAIEQGYKDILSQLDVLSHSAAASVVPITT